ncbi:GGDEF domain-containing protein [Paracidovorax avenae]|uniref:bifunctional diguanylate cyclase/phosphodiesterase n=1 Tax=Paracidovorax avenae TaxID=80867 RepID=UPI000D159F3F|nr:bifunctional diguanylate cyclase/phosphodiesterase [Paracidovorax avenae]AVS67266.1 GGDEF domain-containing protein [Paracidovorax avenae]AVS78065.1 GGDEF domain-containing protein [Paracidovorax avenae]AVS81461.1 GGDEF domain-containing protein [Paracidovorax avenae]AVS90774.1 GGDEF domain-containing protein [Paracidovorax avenae]AVS99192.1 GGDEF domain-containing protein [Paracidovorax avenae]
MPFTKVRSLPVLGTSDGPAVERLLREQQTLLDSAGVGIVFIRQRQVVRCNPRYAEIFGYASTREAIGLSSQSLYPSSAAFRALGRAAYPTLSLGLPYRCECQMRRKNGRLFWASLTGRLINPLDTSEGSIWIVDDIDEQRHAQIRLHAAIREKQALFDHAMVGIAFVRNNRLTRCNRHFEQMLGYAPGELSEGSARQQHFSDADWEAMERHGHGETNGAGAGFTGEMDLLAKDGSTVTCEVRSQPLDPLFPEQGCICIAMDVTAQRKTQAELARMHAELEHQVQERTRQLSETVESLHREINDRKHDQERIYWLAHYDPLTGLPNRTLLAERAQHAIRVAQENGTPLAVVFLDLDHFKHVNDSLGHRVGDALLVEIAKRLRAVVRDRDTVSRLGGDEFILLLPGANAHGAARVATKLQEASRQPYQIGHHELTMAPSMGIALFPDDGSDFDTLTQSADVAMYRAKLDGRNTYRFFTPEMQAQSVRALLLENALRRALERDQLRLHYQPQITIASGEIRSVEALLRWDHPELGPVSPAEFIPIAEDSGQILQIGEWVMRTALAQLQAWHAMGLEWLSMAVNLSALQFRQPLLPELVSRILDETRLHPQRLELELTEGVAVDDPRSAIATMDQLHARGVRMSMDDFGTGYSSLSQLKRFQIYKLKIDQSFVRDLGVDSNDRAIVSAIIRMAQALGMRTTAEGVETAEQLEYLRQQGCDEAQGYYFSRPQTAEAITPLLRQRKIQPAG